tara:strand:+ start:229 stop:852 length:624 start_codon:yes stop_codon:yes gene_type:complete
LKTQYYKDISNDAYQFIFRPGSGGSFLKACMYGYIEHLEPVKHWCPTTFKFLDNGEYVGDNRGKGKKHIHLAEDIRALDSNSHDLIAVTYTPDDLPLIWQRNYTTWESKWIDDNPEDAINAFPEISQHLNYPAVREQAYYKAQERIESTNEYLSLVSNLNVVLKVEFQKIISGDLNNILGEHFKVEPLPHIGKWITLYQEKNKPYLT